MIDGCEGVEVALPELYGAYHHEIAMKFGAFVLDSYKFIWKYEEDLQSAGPQQMCGSCFCEMLQDVRDDASQMMYTQRVTIHNIINHYGALFEAQIPAADHAVLRDAQGMIGARRAPAAESLDTVLSSASSSTVMEIIRLALTPILYDQIIATAYQYGANSKHTTQALSLVQEQFAFAGAYSVLGDIILEQAEARAYAKGINTRGVANVVKVLQRDTRAQNIVRSALDCVVWEQVKSCQVTGVGQPAALIRVASFALVRQTMEARLDDEVEHAVAPIPPQESAIVYVLSEHRQRRTQPSTP